MSFSACVMTNRSPLRVVTWTSSPSATNDATCAIGRSRMSSRRRTGIRVSRVVWRVSIASAAARTCAPPPAEPPPARSAVAGAFDGGGEARGLDRLEQVVHRVQLERLHGELVERGHERDQRQAARAGAGGRRRARRSPASADRGRPGPAARARSPRSPPRRSRPRRRWRHRAVVTSPARARRAGRSSSASTMRSGAALTRASASRRRARSGRAARVSGVEPDDRAGAGRAVDAQRRAVAEVARRRCATLARPSPSPGGSNGPGAAWPTRSRAP